MNEEKLKQEIERAIRTTLIVLNKQSIYITVDKIYKLVKNETIS